MRKRVRRWRGYLVKAVQKEDGEPVATWQGKSHYVEARSPRDAVERLGERLVPHGELHAKLEVKTLKPGRDINDTWHCATREFYVFLSRNLRRVEAVKS